MLAWMRQKAVKLAEARLIDGKMIAAGLRQRVGAGVGQLVTKRGVKPGLATILVGADPASQVYVRSKGKIAAELGMTNFDHRLPAETTEADLLALIAKLNAEALVHGILVQLPLPRHIDTAHVLLAVDPAKDVDGFHPFNVGRLGSSAPGAPLDFPVPCTPLGVSMLLHEALGSIAGCHAVVIGRSNLVGRPVTQLLLRADCTVTIAHSRTRDLPALSRQADILVVAIGRQEFVRGDWIKPGAAVIDVGINRIPTDDGKTRLVGDVAFAEALPVAGHLTPVPGGVGPMTVACLMFNTLQAARRASGLAVKTVEKRDLPVGLGARAEGVGARSPTASPVGGLTRVKI
jgi:methylenetetrahydrofolate dehydrogenase (NADP+)/methenyltetrahydrofolate cyclohydrolase